MRLLPVLFTLIIGNAIALNTFADAVETNKAFGDYTIFFNAFPSTTLPAAMAAAYNIERSGNTAFINITVFKKDSKDTVMRAATLKGTFTDLITTKPLVFREIREQNSISYIAQVHFNNREVLRFDVQVQPQLQAGEIAPVGSPFKVSFTRKFYTEP